MLYLKKPTDFNPQFSAVGCFIEYNGKILLLHRQDRRAQGNTTWCIVGGKVEQDEDVISVARRETKEHKDYRWIAPEEALQNAVPLIEDLDACIALYYK